MNSDRNDLPTLILAQIRNTTKITTNRSLKSSSDNHKSGQVAVEAAKS